MAESKTPLVINEFAREFLSPDIKYSKGETIALYSIYLQQNTATHHYNGLDATTFLANSINTYLGV